MLLTLDILGKDLTLFTKNLNLSQFVNFDLR